MYLRMVSLGGGNWVVMVVAVVVLLVVVVAADKRTDGRMNDIPKGITVLCAGRIDRYFCSLSLSLSFSVLLPGDVEVERTAIRLPPIIASSGLHHIYIIYLWCLLLLLLLLLLLEASTFYLCYR